MCVENCQKIVSRMKQETKNQLLLEERIIEETVRFQNHILDPLPGEENVLPSPHHQNVLKRNTKLGHDLETVEAVHAQELNVIVVDPLPDPDIVGVDRDRVRNRENIDEPFLDLEMKVEQSPQVGVHLMHVDCQFPPLPARRSKNVKRKVYLDLVPDLDGIGIVSGLGEKVGLLGQVLDRVLRIIRKVHIDLDLCRNLKNRVRETRNPGLGLELSIAKKDRILLNAEADHNHIKKLITDLHSVISMF